MNSTIQPVRLNHIESNLPEKAEPSVTAEAIKGSVETPERKIITAQEIANEELRRENDAWLISAEVLQNFNEELKLSKHELQQTIEKLLVTNQELAFRNDELNRSRDYSEAIVTTIREPLIVLDSDLRVKTANRSFYKTFRGVKEETEGKLFYELQSSQWDIPELRSLLERTLQKELFYESYEVKQKFTSIGERVMILNARRIFDSDNSGQLILLAIEDITERRALEDKLKKSADYVKAVLESSPQISFTSSAEGVITYFNQFFLEYAGLYLEEATLLGWASVVHSDMHEEIKESWSHSVQSGEDFQMEMLFKRYDGVYRWHMSRAIAIRNEEGQIMSWIGTANDTHDQKMFSEELERNVQERTQSLKESNSNLESSNNNLEQFAFIASHDLQEPLRKIKTFSSMLATNYKSALPAEGRKLVDRIFSSSERMSTLIHDVLNFSRIENFKDAFEETDLNAILQDVLTDFNLLISEKKAIVNHEKLPHLEVIPVQMNQLFTNIISNSLKFIRSGISPVINITSRQLTLEEILNHSSLNSRLDYFEICIEDNGIGFEQEYADQIFLIFQRLHSEREFPGTGIGLALCKKIVTNHQGDMFAQGRVDAGSSFYVMLPVIRVYKNSSVNGI